MEYVGIVYQGATLGVGRACWLSRLQNALLSVLCFSLAFSLQPLLFYARALVYD